MRDLELERARLPRRTRMGPYFVALPDGRYLQLPRRPGPRRRRGRQVLAPRRRRASATGTRGCAASPTCSPRCSLRTPPQLGSQPPGDLLDQLRTGVGRSAGSTCAAPPTSPACSRCRSRDLLDEWFESPELQGVLAVNGVIGTWAGPDRAGHRLRDGAPHDRRRRRRPARLVGLPRSAAWARSRGAIRRPAESFGAEVRTDAPVDAHRRRDGQVTGVAPRRRRGAAGADRRRRHAPADHVPAPPRPRRAARRLRRATSSGGARARGTVKVNVALDRAARLHRLARLRPPEVHGGTIELCHSLDHVEQRVPGRASRAGPRRGPFADSCHPLDVRPDAVPRGHARDVACSRSGCRTSGRRAAPRRARGLRRPGDRRLRRAGARTSSSSILHRQVIGPVRDGARVRAHRRQHLPRRALARPAVPHAPGPGLRRLPHADRGPVPGSLGDPRRRRRDRHPGAAVHAPRSSPTDRRRRRRCGRWPR